MLFDAYKVAVHLSIVDKVTPVLRVFSGGLKAAGTDVEALQKKLEKIGSIAKAGAGLTLAGFGMMAALKPAVDEAIKYEKALTRFKQMNLGDAINRDADAMARHANVFGNSATDMMDTLRDLHAAFGSYEEAKHFAPLVAKLNAANSAIYGDGHGIDELETRALAKVIEMRGGTVNQAAFMRELDLMQRMKNATGGVIDAKALRAFMSTAGVAGRSLSDDGLAQMSGLIVEMGGNKAGTALMSGYQNLVAGRTTKKAMAIIEKLGLGETSEVSQGHLGTHKQTTTVLKSIKGEGAFKAAPISWIRDVLLPTLQQHGITSNDQILKVINDIFSNRTGANLTSIGATQLPVIMKDAKNTETSHGANGTITDAQSITAGRYIDFQKKIENLGIIIGQQVLPALNPLLDKFGELSQELAAHPGLVQKLTLGFIGLAGALAFTGTILMLTAGFQALGVVLGGFAFVVGAISWPAIAVGALLVGMTLGLKYLHDNWKTIWPKMKTILGQVVDGVVAYFQGLWNRLQHLWGGGADDKATFNRPTNAPAGGFVPPTPQSYQGSKPGDVYIDGKKVGTIVSGYLARQMGMPATNVSSYDPRMSPPRPYSER